MFRQTGCVASEHKNTPMIPAVDICGTRIVLKEEINGLLMPSAGPTASLKLSKFGMFQLKVLTLIGLRGGVTCNKCKRNYHSLTLLYAQLSFIMTG